MTIQTAETMALTHANNQLLQQRRNDRALHPKAPLGKTVADLLGNIRQGDRPRSLYLSAVHLRALAVMRSVPRYLAAFHDAYCEGGSIVIQDSRGEFETVRCPRCEKTRREATLRAQLIASGIEGRYLDTEWDDLELLAPFDRVREKCREIETLIEGGANLLLYGELTGTGKTTAATLCAKAAVRAGYSAHITNLARLCLDVRESYRPGSTEDVSEKAALLRLTTPDLLVIDDLGAGESDTAALERRLLFQALSERQTHRRPTIVTTNLLLTPPAGELKRDPRRPATLVEVMGARVLARLQPLKALHVNHGTNFRTRHSDVSW